MPITVTFRQMFLLVNFPPDPKLNNKMHGAVVLLPSAGHTAVLTVDDDYAVPLARCQVTFLDAAGRRIWNLPTIPPAPIPDSNGKLVDALVKSDAVFGRKMTLVDDDLIKSPKVPNAINGRVLLAGGTFTTIAGCQADWTFPPTLHRAAPLIQILADELVFSFDANTVPAKIRLTSHKNKSADLDLHSHVTITNFENDSLPIPQKPQLKKYELVEYEDLQELLSLEFGENCHPSGELKARDMRELRGSILRMAEDPVCGGEQTTPDPPPDDPPNPPPPSPEITKADVDALYGIDHNGGRDRR